MNEVEDTLLSLGLASNRAEVISNIQEACKSSKKPQAILDLSTPMIVAEHSVEIEDIKYKIDFE